MLRLLLLAAASPPAPPDHAWASPFTEFLWQVEEGPSSAKRWTALPRESRREAKSGPEAGRRHGPLENGPPRTEQLERTIGRDGPGRSPVDRHPATTGTQQPRHDLRLPPTHRQRKHRDGARPTCTDDLRERLTTDLIDHDAALVVAPRDT